MSASSNDSSKKMPASSPSMECGLTAFGEVDCLVERFEQQALKHGIESVNLNDLMSGFIAERGASHFDRNHHEELAVELLRVWMEFAFDAHGRTSVLDAIGQLSGIEISSEGLELLRFESDRLNRSVSSHKIAAGKYPEPNTSWGEFSLLGILGEGAISRVFLARQDSMSGRLVALKITTRETRESELLARIQHSGVVPVYSVHEHNGIYGICMPFVGSSTLADFCEQGVHTNASEKGAKDGTVSSGRGADTQKSWLQKFSRISKSNTATWTCREIANHLRRRQSLVSTWIRASGSTVLGEGHSGEIKQAKLSTIESSGDATAPLSNAAGRPIDNAKQGVADDSKASDFALNLKWWESHSEVVKELQGYDYHGFILHVGVQLASALGHVHRCGVVHCDVKPANILIGWDAQPRLLDFNVSQQGVLVGIEGHQFNQLVGGTPAYMAPEQRDAIVQQESLKPDARVDVFSLGAVLFELLTGCRPPLGAPERWSELKQILASPKLSLSRGLQAVLTKSLAYRPEDRYQTMDEFGEDLSCVLGNRPLVNVPEPSYLEVFKKWRRRHPRLSSGGSVAMLAASMIFTVAAWGWSQHKERQAARGRLAMNQLDFDLPVAVSLMSAVQEYDELRPELYDRIQRVHHNLKLLSQLDASSLDATPNRFASIGSNLRRLQQLWRNQTSSSGGIFSTVYQLPDRESGGHFSRDDLETISDALGLKQSAVSGQFEDLFSRGQFSDAISYAESHPDQFEDYGRLVLFAHCLFRTKQYARASNAYSEAISKEQAFPLAVFYRGVTQLALGEHHQASLDFREVLQFHPEFVSAQFNLGLALMYQDRVQEAELAFSKVLELDPDATQAFITRAKLRMQLNEVADARSDIARAIETNPQDARNLIGLSQLLSAQDPKRAVVLAEQAVKQSPNDLDARQMLAHLLTEEGKEEQAMVHLTHILKMNPNHSLALGGRAVLLARVGNQSRSLADLGKLISQEKHEPLLCYQIACGFSLLADAKNEMDPSGELEACFSQSDGDRRIESTRSTGRKDHLRRAMNWYHKAVTADPSIRSVAEKDSDLKFLRGSKEFSDFENLLEDFELLRKRFSEK